MVIVVPALSTAEDGKNETVLTAVGGCIPDVTDHVCQGIDEKCAMIQRGRRNKESPDEARKAPEEINEQCIEIGRNKVETAEQADFWISLNVPHEIQIGSHMICRQDPSHVRIPKPLSQG